MDNNEGKDNNSEEELEQNTLKKKFVKRIKKKKITIDTEKIPSIIEALHYFLAELKTIENISSFLSQDNLYFFYSITLKDNVKINLLLSRIYYLMLSKDFLFKLFVPSIKKNEYYKIDIILELIQNIAFVLDKLNEFMFSSMLFDLKKKSLGLLNCLYNNCKAKLKKDDEKIEEVVDLMERITKKFYSKTFNELCESQEIFDILKTKSLFMLAKLEEKLSQINNYFEQYEIFKKFVEINTKVKLPQMKIPEENLNDEQKERLDFCQKYGILLLKFCTYHNYIFLDNEEENSFNIREQYENEEDKINNINTEEKDDKVRLIFLIDKMNKSNNNKNEINNSFLGFTRKEKVHKLLVNKRYKSSLGTQQYYDLILLAIKHYLTDVVKNIKSHPCIKPIRDNLCYFLDSFEIESYFPLYLNNLNKMIINDNFSKSFVTNVFPGEANKFYFDVFFKDDVLIYFEFYLEDKTKDLNFELNVYDHNLNKFKPIFKGERVDETFKFFIHSNGYCIYEIIFDNKYSWFNNKYVNFRVSYLNPINDVATEETFDNENYFIVNKEYFFYMPRAIDNNLNIKNIPVILHSNNLTTVGIADKDELKFKEHKEEEEIISKYYFNYILSTYFQKKKINNKKPLLISIFSQNENLTKGNKALKEQLEDCLNHEDIRFIKYIGFIPDKKIYNFNVKYKLYDLNEQLVINHKLLKNKKEVERKNLIIKSFLLINFNKNKNKLKTIFFNKGEFHTEFTCPNSTVIDFGDINISKEEEIYNLIKELNDNMEGVEVIFRKNKNLEKKELNLIERIKKYCQQNIKPSIPFYEYNTNDICINIIKYIYSLIIN